MELKGPLLSKLCHDEFTLAKRVESGGFLLVQERTVIMQVVVALKNAAVDLDFGLLNN